MTTGRVHGAAPHPLAWGTLASGSGLLPLTLVRPVVEEAVPLSVTGKGRLPRLRPKNPTDGLESGVKVHRQIVEGTHATHICISVTSVFEWMEGHS